MSEPLIKYKLMRIMPTCPRCGARQVGGRVYIPDQTPLIAARWLYECGHDEEQFETGVKNIYHECRMMVDKTKPPS